MVTVRPRLCQAFRGLTFLGGGPASARVLEWTYREVQIGADSAGGPHLRGSGEAGIISGLTTPAAGEAAVCAEGAGWLGVPVPVGCWLCVAPGAEPLPVAWASAAAPALEACTAGDWLFWYEAGELHAVTVTAAAPRTRSSFRISLYITELRVGPDGSSP